MTGLQRDFRRPVKKVLTMERGEWGNVVKSVQGLGGGIGQRAAPTLISAPRWETDRSQWSRERKKRVKNVTAL